MSKRKLRSLRGALEAAERENECAQVVAANSAKRAKNRRDEYTGYASMMLGSYVDELKRGSQIRLTDPIVTVEELNDSTFIVHFYAQSSLRIRAQDLEMPADEFRDSFRAGLDNEGIETRLRTTAVTRSQSNSSSD